MMSEATICSETATRRVATNAPETAGFACPESEHVTCVQGPVNRPSIVAWISDGLLAKTKQVWSDAYGRPITEDEAVEILMNVKHLAEALVKAKQQGGNLK
jgi:hypothetical protein